MSSKTACHNVACVICHRAETEPGPILPLGCSCAGHCGHAVCVANQVALQGDAAGWWRCARCFAGYSAEMKAALADERWRLASSLPVEHPERLAAAGTVAHALLAGQRWVDAEDMYSALLPVYQRVFGRTHSETLKTLAGLSLSRSCQGKHAEAEPLLREQLDIETACKGREDSDTLATMARLASSLSQQCRDAEAEVTSREVFATLQRLRCASCADLRAAADRLVFSLLHQGKQRDADAVRCATLETIWRRSYSPWPLNRGSHMFLDVREMCASGARRDEDAARLLPSRPLVMAAGPRLCSCVERFEASAGSRIDAAPPTHLM